MSARMFNRVLWDVAIGGGACLGALHAAGVHVPTWIDAVAATITALATGQMLPTPSGK